jgi:hypothetical protein
MKHWIQREVEVMAQGNDVRKLSAKEYYKCPFLHVHPKHEQGFFKDFDSHFRIFQSRDDHFSIIWLHEELLWKSRHEAAERGKVTAEDLRVMSLKAWLAAIKQQTGTDIQIIVKK